MSNTKVMNPTGHLQIFKLYEDGREELYFDDQNIITSGMGVGFSHLFSASGASSIVDYQIINFLVGSGGDYDDYGVSTYKLQSPVLGAINWGVGSNLITEDLTPIENGVLAGSTFPLARIRFSNVHKVTNTSVRYTLVIDRTTLNTKYINEVGLYMRNPRGLSPPSPILVAYRPFTTITKTSDFSLIFRWTLQF
jgi:hypothetical protein